MPIQERVSTLDVLDYNVWVKEELRLQDTKRRIREGEYKPHEAMLAHIEQIHTNAVKYNTPGNGEIGGPGVFLDVTHIRSGESAIQPKCRADC